MPIQKTLDLLWDLTHCKNLKKAIQDRNPAFYQDRDRYSKELQALVHKDLAGDEHLAVEAVKPYIWFILMLPIENHQNAYASDLRPLLAPLRAMLAKLIEEAVSRGVMAPTELDNHFARLLKAAKTVTSYKTPPATVEEPLPSALRFYRDNQGNPVFEHFSLACAAFFNQRLLDVFRTKKSHRDKSGRVSKEFPLKNQLVDAYPILRDTFRFIESEGIPPQELTKDGLWDFMEQDCMERGYVMSTRWRRWYEYERFVEATSGHGTIWGWKSLWEKNESLAASFTDEEDNPSDPEKAMLMADIDNGFEMDSRLEMGKGDRIPESDSGRFKAMQWQDYLSSIRREKVAAHMRSGGLTLLRHNWWDKRAFTLERLCALIGSLTRGKTLGQLLDSKDTTRALMALSVLESAATGASIERICDSTRHSQPLGGSFIEPIGLYMQTEAIARIFKNTGVAVSMEKSLCREIKANLNQFNKDYPEMKLTLGSMAFGGRAWLIHKRNVNRLLTSHICGVWLPGVRASGQYVRVEGLVGQWAESNSDLAQSLLKVAEKTDLPVLDGLHPSLAKATDLIRMSGPAIKDWLRHAKDLEKLRQEIFDQARLVQIPTDDQIYALLDHIMENIKKREGEEKEEWLSVFHLVIVSAFLLLRPGESRDLSAGSISFCDNSAQISGKGNKLFKEYRVLPLPDKVREFLRSYVDALCKDDGFHVDSKLIQDNERCRELLEECFDSVGMSFHNLYSLRKWGGTKLHNAGVDFDLWQALMGHSQAGFESMGCHSQIVFSQLRRALEKHAAPLGERIPSLIREIKKI